MPETLLMCLRRVYGYSLNKYSLHIARLRAKNAKKFIPNAVDNQRGPWPQDNI